MREHLATFVRDFERYGRQVAVVSYRGNRRIATTYGELALLAGRFSRLLAEQGIAPGDRILLWGANSADWIAVFFGCVLRGVVVVPLDAAGGTDFAARVVSDTSPRLIVGDEELIDSLPEALKKVSLHRLQVQLPQTALLDPDPALGTESILQILYTSGTTSAPKGIVHTHGNVLSSVDVLEREMQKYLRYERWIHPLRFLHTLPLSHVFGQFMGLWVPPLLAAEVHYDDKLIAGHLLDRIRRERISVAIAVPRVLDLLRAHLLAGDPDLPVRIAKVQTQRSWWRWWHTRGVHRRFGWKFWAFVAGGATLPEDVERFWNALGFVLVQGYGMTETTALATLNHPFHTARGSIGKPLSGREVRLAEDGEILVRGPMLASGVWRNGRMEPRSEEWLNTGDLGEVDASGQMRFVGRKGDVIVAASGMNIHPADLEMVLRAQPAVRDAVVVGWDGPTGPEPVAAAILDRSMADSGPSEDAVLAQIRTEANRNLQEYQWVRHVLLWRSNDFPRNSVGKVLRREVAAWVRQQIGSVSPDGRNSSATAVDDPLLKLLGQVTGQPVSMAGDDAELSTDMHLDSLGRMQLAMAMEERFGISVSDEAIATAITLGDLRKLTGGTSARRVLSSEETPEPSFSDRTTASAPTPAHAITDSGTVSHRHDHYLRWPWSAPMQAIRATFIECVMRPLVAVWAHPQIHGRDIALPTDPSIYICNHIAVIDAPLIMFALPGRVRRQMACAMAADLLTGWRRARIAAGGTGTGLSRWISPIQAYLITALFNVFPLPSGAGLRRSFDYIGEALDRGFNVLVFPEGKRTRTGDIQPFQNGISLLADESRTAIVPMALIGLWEASQRKRILSWLWPQGLGVAFGAPMRRKPGESHAEFAARLQDAVQRLKTGSER